ncbi:PREDICTED: uncharacterized protein LOC108756843 isoform X2 [Trachymyrmex septentrionalis]|uniref:uncharacterized protein LOC108756843 isoform X2 n=1 Tax=Trachymyrmex septentrionalis TaxID=34720 RepID=UPI00084F3E74|nr:PREDICTED: uncharacterized protein LOC108756843 isoform X2 [Trachymyrmex septentrionalis]
MLSAQCDALNRSLINGFRERGGCGNVLHRYVTSNNWEIAKKYSRNTPSQKESQTDIFRRRKGEAKKLIAMRQRLDVSRKAFRQSYCERLHNIRLKNNPCGYTLGLIPHVYCPSLALLLNGGSASVNAG